MFYWKNNVSIPDLISLLARATRLLLLLLVMMSCQNQKLEEATYYSVDSLVNQQLKRLVHSGKSIHKQSKLAEGNSDISFIPDSLQWVHELEVFRRLEEINNPANKGLYKVTIEKHRNSNLHVKNFISTDNDLPVQSLKIFYHGTPQNIRILEAEWKENTLMYHASRLLTMEFDPVNSEPALTGYSLQAGQKMFLADTVQYSINVAVSLPSR